MKKKTLLFVAASLLIAILVSGYEILSGDVPVTLNEAGYSKINYITSLPQTDGGSWISAPSIPPGPRYYGASATFTRNDTTWLFITGGDTTGSGHATRTCMKYNFRTNQWSYIAPMPGPRRNHSAAVVGNKMFVYGGLDSPTSNGTNRTYQYFIDLNTWASSVDMPDHVFLQGSDVINDTSALIVGGVNPLTTESGFLESRQIMAFSIFGLYLFLPQLPYGIAGPPTYIPRGQSRGSTIKAYIIGGIKEGGVLSSDVIEATIDLSNLSNTTYTVHSNVIPGGGLARHQVVTLPNGTAIVSGGSRTLNFDAINNHYLFTPPSTFTPLPGSTIPLCAQFAGVGFDGNNYKLLISGGITTGQSLNSTSMIYSDSLMSSISQISNSIPDRISLKQNYPNPFNPSTKIRFDITSAANIDGAVRLAVYDITGREVALLVNQKLSAGSYEYTFDAKGFTSGVYFFRLEAGDFSETKKMTLLK
jgi:hypothetical protein